MWTRGAGPLCSLSYIFDGVASPDGMTFAGDGDTYFSHIRGCWVGSQLEQQGYRCDEQTGCDIASCTGLPDGTACGSAAACASQGACLSGSCQARSSCPLCTTCDGAGACIEAPQPECTASLRPEKSSLQFTNASDDTQDQLRWKWKTGPALSAAQFGDPQASDDVALCVFSTQPGAGSLLFGATLETGNCADPPCWTSGNDRLSFKPNGGATSPFTKITMKSGGEGKTAVEVRAAGSLLSSAGLPATPLATPLTTQLQISNGTCFELDLAADSVKSNGDGSFKANGTTLSP